MSSKMSAAERRELRSVIRQRMKILRADIEARKAELLAAVPAQVEEKFADQAEAAREINAAVEVLTETFRSDVNKIVSLKLRGHKLLQMGELKVPTVVPDNHGRVQYRQELIAHVEAQVKEALYKLEVQEADLLQRLILDTFESDAAKQFLSALPTAADLVPASRLAAITQS